MKIFSSVVACIFMLLMSVAVPSCAANDTQDYIIPANLSKSERSWFKTFQEGNLVADGWQQISADILAQTPERDRSLQRTLLAQLGMKIGLEWCRNNKERKVSTDMLRAWGDILKIAARKNPQQLPQVIAMIEQEVDAVLQ